MMEWKTIETEDAPKPIAPYAQGVDADALVFVSGQLGVDPTTSEIPADVREETAQLLRNLEAILEAAGLSARDVVKTTVYMTDFDDYAEMNVAYEDAFPAPHPARATVKVAGLLGGARVEIEAVAVRP